MFSLVSTQILLSYHVLKLGSVKAQDGPPVKEHDGISCHGNFEQCSKPENIQKLVEKRDSPIQRDSDVPQLNL